MKAHSTKVQYFSFWYAAEVLLWVTVDSRNMKNLIKNTINANIATTELEVTQVVLYV